MRRKLRVEYPGAIYHVINRGNQRGNLFKDDHDRQRFLATLGEACAKTEWQIHAWCLMRNHDSNWERACVSQALGLMNEHLIDLERRAFALKNSGKPGEAAVLFEQILNEQPCWEHGYGAFSLAECYEEQGNFEKAKTAYETAVGANSTDPILLGGYASFLYLHGEAWEAFDTHLRLLAIELEQKSTQGSATTTIALNELGCRLGLSQETIDARIAQLSPRKG